MGEQPNDRIWGLSRHPSKQCRLSQPCDNVYVVSLLFPPTRPAETIASAVLLDSARHDDQSVIRQRPLERFRLLPGRPHPYINLLGARQRRPSLSGWRSKRRGRLCTQGTGMQGPHGEHEALFFRGGGLHPRTRCGRLRSAGSRWLMTGPWTVWRVGGLPSLIDFDGLIALVRWAGTGRLIAHGSAPELDVSDLFGGDQDPLLVRARRPRCPVVRDVPQLLKINVAFGRIG